MTSIRAAQFHGAQDLRIENVPPPPLLPQHIAVAPKFCGLCGSDLHMYFVPEMAESLKERHPLTGECLPVVFGHEFAGEVVEIGPGCAGDLKVGDRVAAMPIQSDGTCRSCREGAPNTCSQIAFLGYHGAGGLSERTVLPERLLFKLPDNIDCDVGALIEPLSVAWHAASLYKDWTPNSTAAIIGAGPVGCAVLLCLKARGISSIVVSEISPEKRKFAASLGASSTHDPAESNLADLIQKQAQQGDDHGVDVVFDCAGAPSTLNTAISTVRPRGTIINIAIPVAPVSVNLLAMTIKEITLKTAIAYTREDFVAVIDAMGKGELSPGALITKRIRLGDVVREGLEILHGGGTGECKILVELGMR